ncbi:MAG: AEC family transporter [Propioniciclava sp.]
MQAALTGIATIALVVAVGWLIARLGLVDQSGRRMMSGLAFSVGSPALLFTLVSRASLQHLFSATLLVSLLAIAVTMIAYLACSWWFHPGLGARVIGLMSASYTNAGNLGLPIALALLGDGSWVAPILLVQTAVIMPVCLALLDTSAARESGAQMRRWRYLVLPLRNPITVGILLGLLVNLAQVPIPGPVAVAAEMMGGMAVPLMLLSFGVSLRLDPRPGPGPHTAHLAVSVAIKMLVHPFVAWFIGSVLFGLTGIELYAVVLLGVLPTAQNVYVISSQYRESELLARDAVFWTTLGSVGTLILIAALFG